MAEVLFIFLGLKQEAGCGLSRGGVFPEMNVISVSWLLSPFSHIGFNGHFTLVHKYTNSAGIRDRYFLQPVIDSSKVLENSSLKVRYQHFVVTHPQPARRIALFY